MLFHRELDRVYIIRNNLAFYKILAIYSYSISKRIYPTYGQNEEFFYCLTLWYIQQTLILKCSLYILS